MAGIHITEYYELTFGEIILVIQAYNEKKTMELKQEAINTYMLADLIASSVGRLLDNKAKYPEIQDVYPHLFQDMIEQKSKQQDWRIMKAHMLAMAEGRQDARQKRKEV